MITGAICAKSAAVTPTGSAVIGLDILGGAYVVDSMTVCGGKVDIRANPPRVPDVRLMQ